jgi:Mg2+/Co2+ transporter CorB
MKGAVQTSETLVNSFQSTRRYNPEDSHLQSRRREHLKSYGISSFSSVSAGTHRGTLSSVKDLKRMQLTDVNLESSNTQGAQMNKNNSKFLEIPNG